MKRVRIILGHPPSNRLQETIELSEGFPEIPGEVRFKMRGAPRAANEELEKDSCQDNEAKYLVCTFGWFW